MTEKKIMDLVDAFASASGEVRFTEADMAASVAVAARSAVQVAVANVVAERNEAVHMLELLRKQVNGHVPTAEELAEATAAVDDARRAFGTLA